MHPMHACIPCIPCIPCTPASYAQVRANIQEELVIELYREEEFSEMLREADDAVRRREDCRALVTALERAQRVVDELRAMPIEGSALDSMVAWNPPPPLS